MRLNIFFFSNKFQVLIKFLFKNVTFWWNISTFCQYSLASFIREYRNSTVVYRSNKVEYCKRISRYIKLFFTGRKFICFVDRNSDQWRNIRGKETLKKLLRNVDIKPKAFQRFSYLLVMENIKILICMIVKFIIRKNKR